MYNSNIENSGSSEATFLNIIRMRAKYQPEKIAFTFIPGKNDAKKNLSYYELDKNIRRIASLLQGKKIKGERAILLFENEQDLIENLAGCLYAGVIAVPVYPPDTSKLVTSLQRIKVITDDSQAKIILASSRVMEIIISASKDSAYIRKHTGGIQPKEEMLKKLALNLLDTALWVNTEVQTPGIETLWVDPGIRTGDPAYIQYTSGSTGVPKGVVISHENILINSRMKADAFEVTSEWGCVSWLPLYHDMGLVGGVFQSLYSGFTSTLMPASTFLTHPLRWLKTISEIRDKPVVSGGPNFAYELCCRRIPASEISNLNLSN
jgi:acyl-CoA synthetase (AMP-forming)/AMP-acid ligase II